MTTPQDRAEPGFRHLLRVQTKAAHDTAEAVFSRFINDPRAGLAWFLAAQHAAFAALQHGAQTGALLSDLTARLESDLADLGRVPVAVRGVDIDPLAVDYLVLGSRLGTEVLRRRLMAETPPMPIPSYFLACAAPGLWRQHCACLDAIAPDSPRARHLTIDVIAGYELFRRAAGAQPD
ncbi:hypothetical protein [Citreicella sp. C3M06]|uniref:hypothetical protein n=1 Tax=Citreicella sp. C3M06 TaxID=2841564 RepID=UPI0020915B94|nr:hypothetical protein [Citreicella sp. C3M06]